MICPHCNTQIPDDVQFCGECGAKLLSPTAPTTTQPTHTSQTNVTRVSPEEEQLQNTKIGIIVVSSIAAFTIVCAIIAIVLFAVH